MKKLLLIVICGGLFTACNPKPTNKNKENAEVPVAISGFTSIEALCTSLVKSIRDNDHESYFTHVMNEEMEMQQASLLTDEAIRKEFLHEYGFSLHQEEAYFRGLINYYEEEDVDLQKINLEKLEYVEYKGGEYEPLELYEVFIPIEMEYDYLIDFTIIKVDGKFYLTSELGI